MVLLELVNGLLPQGLVDLASHAPGSVPDVLAQAPEQTPGPRDVNTEGVVEFLLGRIAPILLAILGLIFIGRAGRGEVSRVITSSAIALVGLAFIGGALVLVFLGEYIVGIFFQSG